jgi:hypothetical protein
MANISSYMALATMNWWMNGAGAATRPSNWGIGLSLGSPTSISGSEVTLSSSNYSRQSGLFQNPAVVAAGVATATNTAAITYSNLSVGSFSGVQVWDTVLSNNSGNMLWYGLLSVARTTQAGDSLVFASGALTAALS